MVPIERVSASSGPSPTSAATTTRSSATMTEDSEIKSQHQQKRHQHQQIVWEICDQVPIDHWLSQHSPSRIVTDSDTSICVLAPSLSAKDVAELADVTEDEMFLKAKTLTDSCTQQVDNIQHDPSIPVRGSNSTPSKKSRRTSVQEDFHHQLMQLTLGSSLWSQGKWTFVARKTSVDSMFDDLVHCMKEAKSGTSTHLVAIRARLLPHREAMHEEASLQSAFDGNSTNKSKTHKRKKSFPPHSTEPPFGIDVIFHDCWNSEKAKEVLGLVTSRVGVLPNFCKSSIYSRLGVSTSHSLGLHAALYHSKVLADRQETLAWKAEHAKRIGESVHSQSESLNSQLSPTKVVQALTAPEEQDRPDIGTSKSIQQVEEKSEVQESGVAAFEKQNKEGRDTKEGDNGEESSSTQQSLPSVETQETQGEMVLTMKPTVGTVDVEPGHIDAQRKAAKENATPPQEVNRGSRTDAKEEKTGTGVETEARDEEASKKAVKKEVTKQPEVEGEVELIESQTQIELPVDSDLNTISVNETKQDASSLHVQRDDDLKAVSGDPQAATSDTMGAVSSKDFGFDSGALEKLKEAVIGAHPHPVEDKKEEREENTKEVLPGQLEPPQEATRTEEHQPREHPVKDKRSRSQTLIEPTATAVPSGVEDREVDKRTKAYEATEPMDDHATAEQGPSVSVARSVHDMEAGANAPVSVDIAINTAVHAASICAEVTSRIHTDTGTSVALSDEVAMTQDGSKDLTVDDHKGTVAGLASSPEGGIAIISPKQSEVTIEEFIHSSPPTSDIGTAPSMVPPEALEEVVLGVPASSQKRSHSEMSAGLTEKEQSDDGMPPKRPQSSAA